MDSALSAFEVNPVIAAVKDEGQLERAIASNCGLLFLLFGSICDIGPLVERAKSAGARCVSTTCEALWEAV